MAKLAVKLEKSDITTYLLGNNISIATQGSIEIIFTQEAVEEFIKDYNALKSRIPIA